MFDYISNVRMFDVHIDTRLGFEMHLNSVKGQLTDSPIDKQTDFFYSSKFSNKLPVKPTTSRSLSCHKRIKTQLYSDTRNI